MMPGGSSRLNPFTATPPDKSESGRELIRASFNAEKKKTNSLWILVSAHVTHRRRPFPVSRAIRGESGAEPGNIFLEAWWKERKTAVMNLNSGGEKKTDLTN